MGTVATARFLIIGNSAAGVKAAEAIRRRCLRGLITVVTEERCPSYARPRLADYVAERLPERALWGVSRNFYTRNNIGLILDKKAVKVDVKASKVLCADGEEIAYDVLLIATGATPNRLSCPGADLNGVATLRTLADAVRIRDRARTAKEVVVVGGGLLGMDLAQAFLERKLKVHHLVREKGLGSPALDPEAARIVEARFREHGATISFEEEVAEFTGAGWELSGVVTTKGRRLSCQLATVSIGVRPNTDFLRGSGLEMDRGILVDGAMRTNIENIYAAGDVAQLRGGAGRPAGIQTSWFNAGAQGQLAGYNMATGEG
jgi:NAD(P)H-nitrite reductase large subunit